jgi:hypothetical protein
MVCTTPLSGMIAIMPDLVVSFKLAECYFGDNTMRFSAIELVSQSQNNLNGHDRNS